MSDEFEVKSKEICCWIEAVTSREFLEEETKGDFLFDIGRLKKTEECLKNLQEFAQVLGCSVKEAERDYQKKIKGVEMLNKVYN